MTPDQLSEELDQLRRLVEQLARDVDQLRRRLSTHTREHDA